MNARKDVCRDCDASGYATTLDGRTLGTCLTCDGHGRIAALCHRIAEADPTLGLLTENYLVVAAVQSANMPDRDLQARFAGALLLFMDALQVPRDKVPV